MSEWTGPREDEMEYDRLQRPVPPERWPYGPPDAHQSCCYLLKGGLFCDCKASDLEEEEWGIL